MGDEYPPGAPHPAQRSEHRAADRDSHVHPRPHAGCHLPRLWPRFQHSTGQACKGGPNSGVCPQITCDDPTDLDVPGHADSFGVVKAAEARGDLEGVVERGRRVRRIHLKDVDAGLKELARTVNEALQ